MPVRFPCSSCGRTLSTARRKAGSFISCPACKSAVLVEPVEVWGGESASPENLFEFDLPLHQESKANGNNLRGPRIFMTDALELEAGVSSGSPRVRLIAWLAAILLIVAVGAILYYGLGHGA